MDSGEITSLHPEEVNRKMAAGETFVLNIITDWCPDCTERQHPNLPVFVRRMEEAGVPVYQLTVQHQRLVFLSKNHEKMVNGFGGHGYPRTVLIAQGKERESAVEVMTVHDLQALADRYCNLLHSGVEHTHAHDVHEIV